MYFSWAKSEINIHDIPEDLATAAADPPLLDCVEVPFEGDDLPLATAGLADTPPLLLVVPTRPTNNV